jgi:hypothetical protein
MPRRYQTVEVTDLVTKTRSWKIFERGRLIDLRPVLADIPTREEALARLRQLEEAESLRRNE